MRILTGDARDVLKTLPDESVQCCVTSPPYYGLRDYGVDGQIGLEKTPDEYIAEMVAVFREVRRVLLKDGTLWVNIGDSYASSAKSLGRNDAGRNFTGGGGNKEGSGNPGRQGSIKRSLGECKEKDLIGIPWMLAFALRADGWYLRRDIIWSKANPMPESIKDRPTSAHEYVFLLSKNARYFYDADAIREDYAPSSAERYKYEFRADVASAKENKSPALGAGKIDQNASGRNSRSVWTIATQPSGIAHFAMMPTALAEKCILAGTSEAGCCPHCGAPHERVTEKGDPDIEHQRACGGDATGGYSGTAVKDYTAAGAQDASAVKARILAGMRKKSTTGWRPTCDCPEHMPVPCTVLDPFSGAGTTAMVADRIGRSAIGIELNPRNVAITHDRIRGDAGMFAEIA